MLEFLTMPDGRQQKPSLQLQLLLGCGVLEHRGMMIELCYVVG